MQEEIKWPLGAALREARELKGLSVPAAAELTKGAVGVTRWRHLESGVEKIRGTAVPIKTTRKTVIAAARAVGLEIGHALNLAGLPPLDSKVDEPTRQGRIRNESRDYSAMSNEELAEEMRALTDELELRLRSRAHSQVATPPTEGAAAIKASRERMGWSVEELAARAHTTAEAVRSAENDPRTVFAGDLLFICRSLGLDPREMVARTSEKLRENGELAQREAL